MKRRLSFAGAGLVLAVTSAAHADDAANTSTARTLGTEGVLLADEGNCKDAVEKLERAEQLHHAPTTAARLGECEVEVGKLVSGTERLQRLIREPLPPNAHPAFVSAVGRARQILDRALPRIPSIRVTVKAPPGTKLNLTIDSEPAPSAIVDANRSIDPGLHEITVAADGFISRSSTVMVADYQTKTVAFELVRDPHAPPKVAVDGTAARTGGSVAAPESAGGSKAPAVAVLGIGVAGLAVGVIAGLTVASKAKGLEDGCDADHLCPAARATDLHDAKTWATVSTIGFAVGGAGVLGGLILFAVSGKSHTDARVQGSIGPGSAAISGRF